jgi:hypothetical protein
MALKLYMVLLGGKPKGRHTEQHDMFFGIAESLKDLIPQFNQFWPEAKGRMHVDGFREVNQVDGQQIILFQEAVKQLQHRASYFSLIWEDTKKTSLMSFTIKWWWLQRTKPRLFNKPNKLLFSNIPILKALIPMWMTNTE